MDSENAVSRLERLMGEAERKASLAGIPHYVLASGGEVWVAGRGARNALWPGVPVLYESGLGRVDGELVVRS